MATITKSGGRAAILEGVQKHTLAELIDRFAADILPGKPAVEEMYKSHLAWWRAELGATNLRDPTSDLIDAAYRRAEPAN